MSQAGGRRYLGWQGRKRPWRRPKTTAAGEMDLHSTSRPAACKGRTYIYTASYHIRPGLVAVLITYLRPYLSKLTGVAASATGCISAFGQTILVAQQPAR